MINGAEGGAGTPKVTAAVLVATTLVGIAVIQQILMALLNLGILLGQINAGGDSGMFFPGYLWSALSGWLPFVVGVFLCLWLLTPLSAHQRPTRVIGRSLVASLCGTLLVFVATILGLIFTGFDTSAGLAFGWAAGAAATASANIGWVLYHAVYTALSLAITFAPVTALAAIIVWLWLRGNLAHSATGNTSREV